MPDSPEYLSGGGSRGSWSGGAERADEVGAEDTEVEAEKAGVAGYGLLGP